MSNTSAIRIGTRKSQLALTQAETLGAAIRNLGHSVEYVAIDSLGDRRRDEQQLGVRDKKEWIIDLEESLVQEKIDIAIHSGKDVPYDIDSRTSLTSVFSRERAADVFIGRRKNGVRVKLAELPERSMIGSSSKRRKAFLLRWSPFQMISEIRGNVPTRLARLEEDSELDGIILAQAGINRLGLFDAEMEVLPSEVMLPAVNQGILVVQYLSSRLEIEKLCKEIQDADTQCAFLAERACIRGLGADCQSSVGVYSEKIDERTYRLEGVVLSGDGSSAVQAQEEFHKLSQAEFAGRALAEVLLTLGAGRLLRPS